MDINNIISESYNLAIEEGFNKYLEENATSEVSEIKVDEEKLIAEIEEKWLNTSIKEIAKTPGEYIVSLNTLDKLIELFVCIASVSDIGVPNILIERLRGYGQSASEMLFSFVKVALGERGQELAVAQAVYAIGCLRNEEYKQKLIELLLETCKDDFIAEAICAAIVEYDESIMGDLMKAFNATEQNEVREHLLSCVAEISKGNPSDEIFYFLKNAFRVVSNLKMAAEVLGDYGDSRAIPFLRGYVLKNIKELDKSTFNHIRAVIKKLGGEIDDLVYTN